MYIRKPAYYDRFRCLGGACPDSCCKDWQIQVDEASARRYLALPGALGDRLRQVLVQEGGQTVMAVREGRCPMWRRDGLCRIQAELGEEALCQVCRDFPRLTHDYGDFTELGLELSCPEAARWILTGDPRDCQVGEIPGDMPGDYDREAMAVLKRTREKALDLVMDPSYSVGEALALVLLYGCQAQAELDGGEERPFPVQAALEEARSLAKTGDLGQIPRAFLELEILTDFWRQRLLAPVEGPWTDGFRALAGYLVQRYWLQAVADYDLYSRVKLVIAACLVIKALGEDFSSTAQLFSKEIENNADNVDALLDGAYDNPAFRDDLLLGLLLDRRGP